MTVVHNNVSYKLPSCVISSSSKGQRGQELVCVPGTEQRVHSCSARGDSSFRKNDESPQSCNEGSCSLRGECQCEKERVGGAHNVSEAVISEKNDSVVSVDLKDPLSNNKFFGLDVEAGDPEPAPTVQQKVENCPPVLKGILKRSKRQ